MKDYNINRDYTKQQVMALREGAEDIANYLMFSGFDDGKWWALVEGDDTLLSTIVYDALGTLIDRMEGAQ